MHNDVRVERVRGLKQHLSLSCVNTDFPNPYDTEYPTDGFLRYGC